MDKRIVFAVAGSGKTSHIIDTVENAGRCLILTYTVKNFENIRYRLIRKYGRIPEGTTILTYFSFLYKFCYKPIMFNRVRAEGMNFTHQLPRFAAANQRLRYINNNNQLYAARIARMFSQAEVIPRIKTRLEKYFDTFLIDEIQDFGGHDFNLLIELVQSEVNVLLVGDYYQHTYDTSRDGNINRGLHDNHAQYLQRFVDVGLVPDSETLIKSYRCSPTVCQFIQDKLGISVESHRDLTTEIQYVDSQDEAIELFNNDEVVKLFYQNSSKYRCHSRNWGESKGEDHHHDICVVLNGTTLDKYQSETLSSLNTMTRNKLYVALSRARGNIYIVPHNLLTHLQE